MQEISLLESEANIEKTLAPAKSTGLTTGEVVLTVPARTLIGA
jgi:hypothetical protein